MDYEKEYKRLQDELHWKEMEERQRRDDEYQQRERQRRERQDEEREAQYYAETWEEAFRKTLPRLRKEASEEIQFAAVEPDFDAWFPGQVEQHEFAREALQEEKVLIRDRVARIRDRANRLIAALEQQARDKAADRIDEKFNEATLIGTNLRNNDLDAVVNW